MKETSDVAALVLAGSPHGNLGIVRSLGRLEVPVYVVQNSTATHASKSRYCTGTFTWDFAAARAEDTVSFLLHAGTKIGKPCLLFPTCDENAILAAKHYEILKERFVYPEQCARLASSLASKKEMYFLARKHGIPTPGASFPNALEDVIEFSRSASFPVMVKGIEGARLKRLLGAGVLIAKTPSELLAICKQVEGGNLSNVMLQEYIPGGDEAVWMFNGYFNSDSDCLFGITGRKIRQYPAYTGATSLGICLPNPTVHETTTRWMKALGYKGILDIGYRYDARDGKYKVLDVNPRIGATFRLFVDREGMDVAQALYLDLTGQQVPVAPAQEGRKWIVEDCDIGSCLRYRRDKKLTVAQWLRSLAGVDEAAYFAKDDLNPFWHLCARSLRTSLRMENAATAKQPRRSLKPAEVLAEQN